VEFSKDHMLITLQIIFTLFAFLSAWFWWSSSQVKYDVEETTVQSLMGKELFRSSDPKQLERFVVKQLELNSRASICAALAALIGLIAIWFA